MQPAGFRKAKRQNNLRLFSNAKPWQIEVMAKISTGTKLGMGFALCLLAACLAVVYSELRKFEYAQVYHPTKDVVPWDFGADRSVRKFISARRMESSWTAGFFPRTPIHRGKDGVSRLPWQRLISLTLRRWYTRLAETGANVLLFDYRGYGKSEGRPSEEGTYRDAQAAYQWLRQSGFAATNIFVYGESLGGAIAAELVLREPAGGLILEGSPTSIADMGAPLFPWLGAAAEPPQGHKHACKNAAGESALIRHAQPGRQGGSVPDGATKLWDG